MKLTRTKINRTKNVPILSFDNTTQNIKLENINLFPRYSKIERVGMNQESKYHECNFQ
jgi:hypothetical protein